MIDKIIPNKLQADLDERLLSPESGQMVDAVNVTRGVSGESTSGVLQNTYGTTALEPRSSLDLVRNADPITVIGKAEDDFRSCVYWFVKDDSGGNQDAIYRQTDDGAGNQVYDIVIKADLNFDNVSFVKADVLNAQFQHNNVNQSILYFTDNVNPPRKINVDRALAGDYDSATGAVMQERIQAIRGAEGRAPEFQFVTDTTVKRNNFEKDVFQFATQYIYRDGEESAISPYSSLAVSRRISLRGIEDNSSTTAPTLGPDIDSRCDISLNIEPNKHDIEEVRLLVRKGNSGAFFTIDQFDPTANVTRNVYGSNVNVYSSASGVYRFYNDRAGVSIPTTTTNKLYDNVPLLAKGQSLSGKRLLYSNYVEGRANQQIDSGDVTLSVSYSTANTQGSSLIPTNQVTNTIKDSTDPHRVQIDVIAAGENFGALDGNTTSNTVVPGGTNINLSFTIAPTAGTVALSSGNIVEFDIQQIDNVGALTNTNIVKTCTASLSSLPLNDVSDSNTLFPINISYTTPFDQQIHEVVAALRELMVVHPDITVVYDLPSTALTLSGGDSSSMVATNVAGKFAVVYSVGEVSAVTSSSTSFVINTKIERVSFAGMGSVTFSESDDAVDEVGPVNPISLNQVMASTPAADTGFTFGGASPNPGLANKSASAFNYELSSGFKAGSTHSFGIVYYDQFNRSGFVNKIGSVYVPTLAERHATSNTSGKGAAGITVTFADSFNSPEWATRYQIVYPGRGSIGDFTQYTVGGAFPAKVQNGVNSSGETLYTNTTDAKSKRLYVSLKTLDKYNLEKNTSRQYSFTKGDKLRIVRFRNSNDTADEFALSTHSTPMEFDVVGVEILGSTADTNPIVGASGTIGVQHQGQFVILEAPDVAAGIKNSSNTQLEYNGFDWFDVTGTSRPDSGGASNSTDNKWGQQVIVEIFSPKTDNTDTIYYEIGHGKIAGSRKDTSINDHGNTIDLYNGDTFFKPVSCKSPVYSSSWNPATPSGWEYTLEAIETSSVSENQTLTDWHKGRAHSVFENAAEVRRENSITYSDAYEEDVENLALSSFNPSLANFLSLDRAYGGVNYIGNRGKGIIALQERKVAQLAVDERIITQSDGGALSALATSPFALTGYYAGDFGCGEDASAALYRDGYVFFFDRSRGKILRLTSEGLSSISDKGVRSLIDANINNFLTTEGAVVSGYDPRTEEYYFTFRAGSGGFAGLTLSYSPGLDGWQSTHSFIPDMYAAQDSVMYTGNYVDPLTNDLNDQTIFHAHTNGDARSTFYGTFANSSFRVVSNNNPSMVKVFNAVSIETDAAAAAMTVNPVTTDLNQTSRVATLQQIEGALYGDVGGDESTNSTRHILPLGVVTAQSNDLLTFANRVNVLPLPVGSTVMEQQTSALANIGNGTPLTARTLSEVTAARQIQISASTTENLVGKELVLVTAQATNGDDLRGRFAEITVTNSTADPFEVYSVNMHFAQSKNNHALGQQ